MKYFKDRGANIVHSHSHSWVERAVLTKMAKAKKQQIVFTFHSLREEYASLSIKKKLAYKYVIKKADLLIATNELIKDKLLKWGCPENKIRVISPFIKPNILYVGNIDEEIQSFVDRFEFYICANASNNNHFSGEDLYGLDLCVSLQSRLAVEYNCCFVYVLTQVTDKEYFAKIEEKIKNLGIADSFLLISHPIDFLSVVRNSKMFLRTTCSDSRPLSVDESVALGIPVVASDVCERPQSCMIYKNRDIDSLYSNVEYVLNNYNEVKEKVTKDSIPDSAEEIIDLYNEILEKS